MFFAQQEIKSQLHSTSRKMTISWPILTDYEGHLILIGISKRSTRPYGHVLFVFVFLRLKFSSAKSSHAGAPTAGSFSCLWGPRLVRPHTTPRGEGWHPENMRETKHPHVSLVLPSNSCSIHTNAHRTCATQRDQATSLPDTCTTRIEVETRQVLQQHTPRTCQWRK